MEQRIPKLASELNTIVIGRNTVAISFIIIPSLGIPSAFVIRCII